MSSPDLWLLRVSDLPERDLVGDPPGGGPPVGDLSNGDGLAVDPSAVDPSNGDAPVGDAPAAAGVLDLLDAEERARAAAFVHDADRIRYVAAHVALRRLLGDATGRPARDLVLIREPCPRCGEPHGRPALADPPRPLHFSLSHGGDLVLIGIAEVPIGVDVEGLPRGETVAELASVLHPGEQTELASLPADQLVPGFARLWTRKEAYLKGLGIGLGRDPSADYLGTAGLAPNPPGWTVTDLPTDDPDHAAALAIQGGSAAEVRVRRLSAAFVLQGHPQD
ncbi:4'-phosphopantetheinyl transferase superfamily protein [Streptacidiphilus sp. N1-12]|uniref:4'-phosphopantetheinyl transferase superfamily protein n=2 Tax=Streptacidiphilus alkalitolerans TaxID=3342712 RepID=A0ABV6VB56_9ACTN